MILGIALRVYSRAVEAEGHALPPDFGRSVTPISTGIGWADYAIHNYYLVPPNF